MLFRSLVLHDGRNDCPGHKSLRLRARDERDGILDVQLVVVNDHGGSIFEKLEPAQTLEKENFERLFKTPQSVNIATLAVAYGWLHIPVHTEVELAAALQTRGQVLIEIRLA